MSGREREREKFMAVVAGMDVKASAVHGTSEGEEGGDAPNTKEAQDERRDHFGGLRTPNTVPNFGTGAAKICKRTHCH